MQHNSIAISLKSLPAPTLSTFPASSNRSSEVLSSVIGSPSAPSEARRSLFHLTSSFSQHIYIRESAFPRKSVHIRRKHADQTRRRRAVRLPFVWCQCQCVAFVGRECQRHRCRRRRRHGQASSANVSRACNSNRSSVRRRKAISVRVSVYVGHQFAKCIVHYIDIGQ